MTKNGAGPITTESRRLLKAGVYAPSDLSLPSRSLNLPHRGKVGYPVYATSVHRGCLTSIKAMAMTKTDLQRISKRAGDGENPAKERREPVPSELEGPTENSQ